MRSQWWGLSKLEKPPRFRGLLSSVPPGKKGRDAAALSLNAWLLRSIRHKISKHRNLFHEDDILERIFSHESLERIGHGRLGTVYRAGIAFWAEW